MVKKWASGGVVVDSVWDERSPIAIADGHNGIAIMWYELTYGGRNLKMQRLNHNGIPQFAGGIKYFYGTAPFDSYSYTLYVLQTIIISLHGLVRIRVVGISVSLYSLKN